ncbi:hypothetical protein CGRA01v4_02124 [Colletotrichum graminicola]|nr:hypothetical protein CGRA01v4_02124 [Colletotrichum graminicola]
MYPLISAAMLYTDWHCKPSSCNATPCHATVMSKSKGQTNQQHLSQSLGLLTSLRFGGGLLLAPRSAVHSGEDWNYHLTESKNWSRSASFSLSWLRERTGPS